MTLDKILTYEWPRKMYQTKPHIIVKGLEEFNRFSKSNTESKTLKLQKRCADTGVILYGTLLENRGISVFDLSLELCKAQEQLLITSDMIHAVVAEINWYTIIVPAVEVLKNKKCTS